MDAEENDAVGGNGGFEIMFEFAEIFLAPEVADELFAGCAGEGWDHKENYNRGGMVTHVGVERRSNGHCQFWAAS
jgi:hypothetical protein